MPGWPQRQRRLLLDSVAFQRIRVAAPTRSAARNYVTLASLTRLAASGPHFVGAHRPQANCAKS